MSLGVLIVAIVMGTITFVTLASIWLGTSYSLKKRGYNPDQTRETYHELKSDLQRISADLDKIREHIADLIILNHDLRSRKSISRS